ncbi:Clavaminate synthase-like protein [Ramicandelaber brevisporus]|nr:Clavaminate synthase-like protein [Ramicandelaber brevisporus]
MSPAIERSPEGTVILNYSDLISAESVDLRAHIELAFGSGPDCLGILLVRGVPGFPEKRDSLLRYGSVIPKLPTDVLKTIEHEASKYSFGWSHGKEVMNGKPDVAKGSYYNNPTVDVPQVSKEDLEKYPEYCHPNIWPTEAECPGLSAAFKDLGGLIVEVGSLVARKCDQYVVSKELKDYPEHFLEDVVKGSVASKARLLHYFPLDKNLATEQAGQENANDIASWCGWHLDHSCITGLTSAMFADETTAAVIADPRDPAALVETKCPDPEAGLYIKSRSGEIHKVSIPRDMIAFQTGEALAVSSDGFLRATPHCVRGISPSFVDKDSSVGSSIARNTFAVFMQPNIHHELRPGYTFADFTKEVLARHYK